MTNTPERKIHYLTASDLEAVHSDHDFDTIIAGCKMREIHNDTFSPSKISHPGTVKDHGAVYTDETGIRAVIFIYTHADGKTVRSIKRLVTATDDYRLPQPPASPDSKSPISSIRKQQFLVP